MSVIEIAEKNLVKAGKKFSKLVFLTNRDFVLNDVLVKAFPNRVFNFGLAERSLLLSAVGFFSAGRMPVVLISDGFFEKTFDVFKDIVCSSNLNIKFVYVGDDDGGRLVDGLFDGLSHFSVYSNSEFTEFLESYGPSLLRLKG